MENAKLKTKLKVQQRKKLYENWSRCSWQQCNFSLKRIILFIFRAKKSERCNLECDWEIWQKFVNQQEKKDNINIRCVTHVSIKAKCFHLSVTSAIRFFSFVILSIIIQSAQNQWTATVNSINRKWLWCDFYWEILSTKSKATLVFKYKPWLIDYLQCKRFVSSWKRSNWIGIPIFILNANISCENVPNRYSKLNKYISDGFFGMPFDVCI